MADNNGGNSDFKDDKGKFLPGNPGKPKGAVTKVSLKVKEAVITFLELNIDKIQDSFDELKAREKLQFIAEILPYATPKLSSVQTEIQGEMNHKIEKVTVEIVRSNGKLEDNTGL